MIKSDKTLSLKESADNNQLLKSWPKLRSIT
jgi:hypothetical protein